MSDPSLGLKRNLADYREDHPFEAVYAFLGAPSRKKSNAARTAPSKLLTSIELGKGGNIRTPYRVTSVKSDAFGPQLLNLDNPARIPVQTALGHAEAFAPATRSKSWRLTKKPEDLLELFNRDLCISSSSTTHTPLSSLISQFGRALVYCPSESFALQTFTHVHAI